MQEEKYNLITFNVHIHAKNVLKNSVLPGNSFLVNISVSVKLGCGDAIEDSQDDPCTDVGGATKVEDLVTTSFNILRASFQ